ncbi:MAG: AAA family ATPase [Ruminococcus sp.]|nr:AAA family ATPase [Ruminococcus sp.]MBP1537764.1 AAA family ATPase [Ruminococcus sp.]
MKIQAQKLKGISSISIDIPAATVSLLTGANGAGKTTLATTPYWVLTGKGLSMKKGESFSSGEVTVGNDLIRREKKKTTGLFLNGSPVSEKGLEQLLSQRGLPMSVLGAFYAPQTELTAEDLLSAAKLSLTAEKVIGLMSLDVPEEAELSEYVNNEGLTTLTLKEIGKCEKHFTDVRRNLKKDIKALEARISDIEDDEETCKQEIESLNKMLEGLLQAKGQQDATKKTLQLVESAKKDIESFANEKVSLSAEVSQKAGFEKALTDIERKLADLANRKSAKAAEVVASHAKADEKREDINRLRSAYTGLTSTMKAKEDIVTSLETVTSCPLCPSMPCTADKSEAIKGLKAEIGSLKKEKESKEKRLVTLDSELSAIEQKISEGESVVANILAEEKKILVDKANIENNLKSIERAAARLSEIAQKIKDKEQLINTVSILSGANEDLTGKITETRNFIQSENQKLQKIRDNTALEKELSLKKLDCDIADSLVKSLQGLPAVIAAKITKPLSNTANSIVSSLKSGWNIEFQPDGSVIVDVGGEKYEREDLSGGERVILNYILKVVVAKLIGLDTIIVDDCDRLDNSSLKELIKVATASGLATLLVTCNSSAMGVNEIKI